MASTKIRRLPRYLRYWRRLTGAGGFASAAARRDAILTLSSRHIPWRLFRAGSSEHLYVPALYESMAGAELAQYARENIRPAPSAPPILHNDWQWAPLYLLTLLFFYGALPFGWQQLGSLDGSAVLLRHEWWRLGTALTLHVDWGHVVSNVFFGSLFLCPLARLTGLGQAWLLTFLGGFLGNALSLSFHTLAYASVGFSTAVFATLGSLAGIYICQKHERLYLPVAAALALLAMLGSEGIRTDYVAHLCGLASGLSLGLIHGLCVRRHLPQLPQTLAAILAIVLPVTLWILAVRS